MKEITSSDDLEQVLGESDQKPVFIFKHSTACPISAGAKDKVSDYIRRAGADGLPAFYIVRVIESRPISNKIAEDLGVRHQSPQLILVNGRKAVWSASHYGIEGERIGEAVAEHAGSR